MFAAFDDAGGAPASAPGPARPAPRLAAAALALLAALAAFGALALRRAETQDRDALVARAAALGVTRTDAPATFARLERESDPARRRVVLARRLVDLELLRGREGGADGREIERLAAARELAREALALSPASWEGAMLDGAAEAMLRLRRRDTRLVTAARDWEEPLLAAARRYPAGAEPRRFLAAAWLEVWPALSPARRPAVEAMLREAFEDERFFDRLFGRWLEIAGGFDRAIALLPDRPRTWQALGEAALARRDLDAFARFWRRGREAQARAFGEALARRESGASDPAVTASALEELSAIVVAAPVDGAFAPLVARALALRPGGPPSPALAEASRRWLAWAHPLCLLADCRLPPAALARLASFAGAALAPEDAAFAAVAAGDAARGERLARRSDALWSENWAPYLTLAARARLAAGDVAGARALLAQVHRPSRARLATRLAERDAGAPDGGEAEGPAATHWEPNEWRLRDGRRALELLPAHAGGLAIALHQPLARPSLVLVEIDGGAPEPLALATGARLLRIAGPLAAAPHLVRVSPLAGDFPPFDLTTLE